MRVMTAAMEHLKMTSRNVIIVISLLILLLMASLMVTRQISGGGVVNDPQPKQENSQVTTAPGQTSMVLEGLGASLG